MRAPCGHNDARQMDAQCNVYSRVGANAAAEADEADGRLYEGAEPKA